MIIGMLKEIKTKESRVAMTPAGVEQLVGRGHTVCVETHAGEGSGFTRPAVREGRCGDPVDGPRRSTPSARWS